MNKKTKRIRALRSFINADNSAYSRSWAGATEPCYILRQSDIRALAEQMVRSSVEWYKLPQSAASSPRALAAALHCLKRAGMTPGKAGAK